MRKCRASNKTFPQIKPKPFRGSIAFFFAACQRGIEHQCDAEALLEVMRDHGFVYQVIGSCAQTQSNSEAEKQLHKRLVMGPA